MKSASVVGNKKLMLYNVSFFLNINSDSLSHMIYSKREVNEQLKKLKKADRAKWTEWELSFYDTVEGQEAEQLSEKQREKVSQIFDKYCH